METSGESKRKRNGKYVYSLSSFIFSFAYFFYYGHFVLGILCFILNLILTLRVYFIISFFFSIIFMFSGGVNRDYHHSWPGGYLISIFSVIALIVFKLYIGWL